MHLILPSALAEVLKQPYALPRTELHLSIIMLTSYFFVLNKLWTLCTLWRSFGSPDPLFSSFYRLFLQKTGGGVPLTAKIPADPGLRDASSIR
jgi:hypothetical protein